MIIEDISLTLIDFMGSDLSVVNSARVSFNKQTKEYTEQDGRLIKYLTTNGHWSPFTHNCISIRCKAPIFLARQLVKHNIGASWNEVSRRYVDTEPTFYIPQEFHKRPEGSIKQGCGERISGITTFYNRVEVSTEDALREYKALLENLVAPEEARMVLPLNTMTEWVWTGNLYFFARVYNQRSDSHAQLAAQDFANKLSKCIPESFKVSWKALTTTKKD